MRPNLGSNDGAAVALESHGLVLAPRMHERIIHADTCARTRTALDIDPSEVATREVTRNWTNLKE